MLIQDTLDMQLLDSKQLRQALQESVLHVDG